MKFLSLNLQNGGIFDTKGYDMRKKDSNKDYGVLYQNGKWNETILEAANKASKQIESNINNILNLIKNKNVDIVVLQEFQMQYADIYLPTLEKIGFKYIVYSRNIENNIARNGVLVASKEIIQKDNQEYPISEEYDRRNFINVKIADYEILGIHVDSDYIKSSRSNHKKWLDDFTKKNVKNKTIVIGDFNAAKKEDRAKKDINTKILEENSLLIDNILDKGFRDAWIEKNNRSSIEYTWYYRADLQDGRRLDYCFISNEIKLVNFEYIHTTNTTENKKGFSDHSAMILEID